MGLHDTFLDVTLEMLHACAHTCTTFHSIHATQHVCWSRIAILKTSDMLCYYSLRR